MVRDPIAGLRGLLSRIALVAPNPASIPLRSIGGDSEAMASRWRNSPETKWPGKVGRCGSHRLRSRGWHDGTGLDSRPKRCAWWWPSA